MSSICRFSLVTLVLLSVVPWTVHAADHENSDQNPEIDPSQTIVVHRSNRDLSTAPFMLHIAIGGSFALADDLLLLQLGESGVFGTIGGDIVMGKQLAFSIIGGVNNLIEGNSGRLRDIFVGSGFKMFFSVDDSPALTEQGGSAVGDVWMDVHFSYHRYRLENHVGIDIGLGYDFELGRELNLGPVARIQFTPWGEGLHFALFSVGLRLSLGGKAGLADRDGDGVERALDRCPEKRENKNGFEDEDGCPDERID